MLSTMSLSSARMAARRGTTNVGAGTMSRLGAKRPCCPFIMTMEDIRLEGRAGRLGTAMTAVVVDGQSGKEYRLPTDVELRCAADAEPELRKVFAQVPFGLPTEPLPTKEALGFRVPLYGLDQWHKLFTPRQLVALGTLTRSLRELTLEGQSPHGTESWITQSIPYLALAIDRYKSGQRALPLEPATEIERHSPVCSPVLVWRNCQRHKRRLLVRSNGFTVLSTLPATRPPVPRVHQSTIDSDRGH